MTYKIEYSPDAENHLRVLTTRQQRTVLDKVDEQLKNQPNTKTKNRKPMRPNVLATWELRIGNLRVYYEIGKYPNPVVHIHAIGIKEPNQVRIGGKAIEL